MDFNCNKSVNGLISPQVMHLLENTMYPETTRQGPDLGTAEAASAALRTFFRIAEAWGLSSHEQQELLGCGRSRFYEWKAGVVKAGLDRSVLERLSHIFGIHASLQVLLPIPERANAWVRKPNAAPLFGGRSALERMLGGQVSDIFVVRQYLDAQRGGWN